MSTALKPTLHVLLLAALLTSLKARAEDWPQWRGLAQDGHAAARAKVPEKLAETPKVAWRLKIGDGLASPVVAQGNLVDFDAQAGKETLHLISADTAKEAWSHPIDDTFKDSQSAPGPRCTPLIDGDRVYAQSCRGELKCLRASQTWTSKETMMNFASPVVVGKQIYGLGPARNLFCADAATGTVRWSKDGFFNTSADKSHAAFLVLGKNILTLSDGGMLVLFAADPKEFKSLGQAQICGSTWCNPAYANGHLYLREKSDLIALQLL